MSLLRNNVYMNNKYCRYDQKRVDPQCVTSLRFKNFARVPSVIDSPMNGTTASTRSPTGKLKNTWVCSVEGYYNIIK